MAAYLAGRRLHRLWLAGGESWSPTKAEVLSRLADDDGLVLCSLGARRWWRWFDAGWDDNAGWDR